MVSYLLVFAWAFVGFFVIRYIAKMYFREPNRATVMSLAVVLTFLGTSLAHSDLATVPAPAVASPPPDVAAANAPAPTVRNVSNDCKAHNLHVSAGAFGSLDALRNGGTDVPESGQISSATSLVFAGWAADKNKTMPARAICLEIDGVVSASGDAVYGVPRPDVSTALKNDVMTPTGFSIQVSKIAKTGKHTFGVAVESSDGTWQSLSKEIHLTVT